MTDKVRGNDAFDGGIFADTSFSHGGISNKQPTYISTKMFNNSNSKLASYMCVHNPTNSPALTTHDVPNRCPDEGVNAAMLLTAENVRHIPDYFRAVSPLNSYVEGSYNEFKNNTIYENEYIRHIIDQHMSSFGGSSQLQTTSHTSETYRTYNNDYTSSCSNKNFIADDVCSSPPFTTTKKPRGLLIIMLLPLQKNHIKMRKMP